MSFKIGDTVKATESLGREGCVFVVYYLRVGDYSSLSITHDEKILRELVKNKLGLGMSCSYGDYFYAKRLLTERI